MRRGLRGRALPGTKPDCSSPAPQLLDTIGAAITLSSPKTRMADLKSRFDQATTDSKNLPERPDNMTLLKIYALFKQASSGDAGGERPGLGDMMGRAKWDAWNSLKGKSADEAMQDYIDLIASLK